MDAVPLGLGLHLRLSTPDPMDAPQLYVGIDVASETLAVVATAGPGHPSAAAFPVANDPDGFAELDRTLAALGASPTEVRAPLRCEPH